MPVLASFSETHPEYVTRAVDVADFESGGFSDPESGAVEDGQHGAMAEIAGRLQQGFDLIAVEDQGQLLSRRGKGMRSMATFWWRV